jgi:hypothetical protein
MYKLLSMNGKVFGVYKEENGVRISFSFDPANTDYANFKKEVLAGAELQDDTGNVMTDASAYIASLP